MLFLQNSYGTSEFPDCVNLMRADCMRNLRWANTVPSMHFRKTTTEFLLPVFTPNTEYLLPVLLPISLCPCTLGRPIRIRQCILGRPIQNFCSQFYPKYRIFAHSFTPSFTPNFTPSSQWNLQEKTNA